MPSLTGARERRHHALHLHEARAFDQNRVALQAGNQFLDAVEVPCAFAECLDRMARRVAQREQLRNSLAARIRAHLTVELGAVLADLAHVAEHQRGGRRAGGEHVDRRAHRIGVRVVAVVDHRGAACGFLDLQPARVRTKRAQALRDGFRFDADSKRAGCSGKRVAHVVQAGDRERRVGRAGRRAEADLARQPIEPVAAGDRAAAQAEVELAACARAAAEKVSVRVVRIDHRDAFVAQSVVDRGVLGRDVLDRAHELEVLALRVVDQRHRRARDLGEVRDLAPVVHAELDRAPAVRMAQAEQRERQPDVVVQVAARGQHGFFTRMLPEDRRQHLLDRGLAVRAGDGNERRREARAPVAREIAEAAARVVDHQCRQRVLAAILAVDHRRRGLRRRHCLQKIVAVEALAAQRDEEIARLDRAAVGRHAGEQRVGPAAAGAERGRGLGQPHHPFLLAFALSASSLFDNALRACSSSEKCVRRPAISW